MASNPAYRDPHVWRAELAGKCGCCGTPFDRGTWIRRDERLRITVLDGHQSAVTR
jgi:hypothetical protein